MQLIERLRENVKPLIFLYFILGSICMVPAQALGLGLPGVLEAMVIAGLLFFLIIGTVLFVKKKVSQIGLSRRDVWNLAWGKPAPSQIVDADAIPILEGSAPLYTRKLPVTEDLIAVDAGANKQTRALVVPGEEDGREERLPDRIIENNGLYLADFFMPDVNTLFGQIIAIFGIRGYGKSNLFGVIAEEMGPYKVPLLIVDTKGEYGPLARHQYLPEGYQAGSPDLQGHAENFMPLAVKDAYRAGRTVMAELRQIVLNMVSYETNDEAALVLCELIRGMDDWAQERHNSQRIPVMVLMDEAAKWLPQNGSDSVVAKTTQHYLNKTFFGTMVNRGRSNGWGLVVANQRIQGIDKQVLQAPWKFLFYQTQKVDLDQYATFGLTDEDIFSLRVGECYIFSPTVIGFRTSIRLRCSPHESHTPGLEQLMAYRDSLKKQPVPAPAPIPIAQSQIQVPESLPVPYPVGYIETSKEYGEDEKQGEVSSFQGLNKRQQQALTLFQQGMTQHREIAAAMEISESDAYRLLIQLDTAGLIQRPKKFQVVS